MESLVCFDSTYPLYSDVYLLIRNWGLFFQRNTGPFSRVRCCCFFASPSLLSCVFRKVQTTPILMEGCVGWDCVKRLIRTQKIEIHFYLKAKGKVQSSRPLLLTLVLTYTCLWTGIQRNCWQRTRLYHWILQQGVHGCNEVNYSAIRTKQGEVASFTLVSYYYSLNVVGPVLLHSGWQVPFSVEFPNPRINCAI